ncbi:MAG: pyruvate kinase [Nitrospirota bacterium]|nr:pyruvate kinase [Nitrospirota bacterium]
MNTLRRRTKIVATIGPATANPEMIERLIRAGVNVIRLNMSHGTHDGHAEIVEMTRAISSRLDLPVAILLDLQGPKIRTGHLRGDQPVMLASGEEVILTVRDVPVEKGVISTNYKALPADVKEGDRILINDGLIELRVISSDNEDIRCSVVHGGLLDARKGINLPDVEVSISSLTEKDMGDLQFGIAQKVDYVALSFVRKAEDVEELREAIAARGADIPIIAKIEKPEAVRNLEAILAVTDGVMVARGDLGVEAPAETVPVLQKKIIHAANVEGKMVITATQMLESMIANPRPTRAEASDVANAIWDGTDAVMLSGETASGKYPVEAVETMSRIALEAEASRPPRDRRRGCFRHEEDHHFAYTEAVTSASCLVADELAAKVIVAFTQSGATARLVSRQRPRTPIIAFTPIPETYRRLSLVWGVIPRMIELARNTDEMVSKAEDSLCKLGLAKDGDTIVIISGTTTGMRGATNMMKVDRIGDRKGAEAGRKGKYRRYHLYK